MGFLGIYTPSIYYLSICYSHSSHTSTVLGPSVTLGPFPGISLASPERSRSLLTPPLLRNTRLVAYLPPSIVPGEEHPRTVRVE